jgi:hypothetical protein
MRARFKARIRWRRTSTAHRAPLPGRRAPSQDAEGDDRATSCGRFPGSSRAIQGWLGHRSITRTGVYTAQAPNRFKDFWRD